MKKLVIIAAAILALSFAFGTVALANNGPHGSYTVDTDMCAGCHRAHTADSGVTWTDALTGKRSALLFGAVSTKMTEFCYTCHGFGAPGAGTDVQYGRYDGELSIYGGDSAVNQTLNGGGFQKLGGASGSNATSKHRLDAAGIAWGENTAGNNGFPTGGKSIDLDCSTCHDPHGSSNYRILADRVNAVNVGGYNGNRADPFVMSSETGYPGYYQNSSLSSAGFDLNATYPNYKPNYTSPKYANDQTASNKNMSGWCGACHGAYLSPSSSYDSGDSSAIGLTSRHRHRVNVQVYSMTADAGVARIGDRELMITTTAVVARFPTASVVEIPLEDNIKQGTLGSVDSRDMIGCLTCHRAHGTTATMSGWANSSLSLSSAGYVVMTGPDTGPPGNPGVQPANGSVLLRANNRGVCERCHNK